jgi:hypothetical protein
MFFFIEIDVKVLQKKSFIFKGLMNFFCKLLDRQVFYIQDQHQIN